MSASWPGALPAKAWKVRCALLALQELDFIEPFPGKLVSVGDGLAFDPDTLPEELELPAATWILAGEAEKALGRLGGLLVGGGSPVSPQLVSRPLLRREAIESSRIEGMFTTPEQLVLFETDDGESSPDADDETREVQNYLVALEWAAREMKHLPISARLIRGIHERLLRDVRGAYHPPGEAARCRDDCRVHGTPAKPTLSGRGPTASHAPYPVKSGVCAVHSSICSNKFTLVQFSAKVRHMSGEGGPLNSVMAVA